MELKARTPDLTVIRERVVELGAERQGREQQRDRYFRVPAGRLKLRESSRDGAHLIAYLRPDEGRFREARFHRLPVTDVAGLASTLTVMLGAGREVVKQREVWRWRDVRIHLDHVEGLGTFVEFEARIDRIGDPAEADRRLTTLFDTLGLEPDDVLTGSYGEMTCESP